MRLLISFVDVEGEKLKQIVDENFQSEFIVETDTEANNKPIYVVLQMDIL